MRLGGLKLRPHSAEVPSPVAVYALLGLLDFGFSIIAFNIGYKEANPILLFYLERNLFEVAKIFATVSVVLVAFYLWKLSVVRSIMIFANVAMAGLSLYHFGFWMHYLYG